MDATKFIEAELRSWKKNGVTEVRDRRVHLDRNDVTVRLQEIGEGPPVLFIHAAMVSGIAWASLAARVHGFRCLLLDRPGCGLSDPLKEAPSIETLPRLAETLVIDVLDALEIERANLASASFGGYFALHAAAAHPGRVDRLIQFGFPVGAPVGRLPVAMRIASLPVLWRLAFLPANRATVRMMFRQIGEGPSLKGGRITEEDVDACLALFRYTDTRRNEMAMGRAFFTPRGVKQLTLADDLLGSIRAPTYLCWGEKEPAGGEDTARQLAHLMPSAELELVPGAGHAVWISDLDRSARTLERFFARPRITNQGK